MLCGGGGGPGGGAAVEIDTFRQPMVVTAGGRDNKVEAGLGGGGPEMPGGAGRAAPNKLEPPGASGVCGRDGVGGEGAGGAGTAGAVAGDDQCDPTDGLRIPGAEGGSGEAEGGTG